MRTAILTLAAALASPPVFAQQPAPPAAPPAPAQGSQTSDAKKEDPEHLKGYGYGTPSGVESNASAGQAVQKKRPKSKAPQDEERTPKKKKKGKKARGAAHAPSPETPRSDAASPAQPGSAAQQQGDPQK